MGYSTEVKDLERRYHSIVRGKKRKWLLRRLQEVVAEFYSNPGGFWRTVRGPRAPSRGPLQDHTAWDAYIMGLPRPLAGLTEVALSLDVCPTLGWNLLHV